MPWINGPETTRNDQGHHVDPPVDAEDVGAEIADWFRRYSLPLLADKAEFHITVECAEGGKATVRIEKTETS